MTFSEIERLHEMGFSAEQIVTLSGGSLSPDPATDPAPDPATDPAPDPAPDPATDPAPDPAPDPLADKVTALDAKLNDFIKAMQANNLKTASIDILPEDQFEKTMDDALSEIIRPSYNKKEV